MFWVSDNRGWERTPGWYGLDAYEWLGPWSVCVCGLGLWVVGMNKPVLRLVQDDYLFAEM